MADVIFEDFSIQVQDAIENNINIALEEAAGELESQVMRRTRVDKSDTVNSWKHKVDVATHTAYIGNPLENAIWEEFGTGEYAINGNGRSGYWVFVKGQKGSKKIGKSYTLEQAKKIMAILRSKGLEAYYTKGKKPSRAFHKAYTENKSKIINLIQNKIKEL